MATLVSSANGNWATASTWGVVDTTSLSADNTSNVTISTSYITTAAFTPGAIEINAIAVKMYRRLKTTGTFTVELYDNTAAAVVSGTTVTIDMADVPVDDYATSTSILGTAEIGGWLVMRFGFDVYTNVTLLAGHSYSVRAICSDTSAIGLYRNATANNFDRMLITTTTATPVAADRLIIAGYHTGQGAMTDITVDYNSNSATDYGQITVEDQGIFNFLSDQTTIALKTSGNLVIHGNGSLICGTVVSPIPDTTQITITMDCASVVQYGLIALNGSYVTFHGQERSYVYSGLNGDVGAGDTAIVTEDSTGWKDGDTVVFTATSNVQNGNYIETRTLSGNASGTGFTLSSALTYNTHQGGDVNPDIRGHVANLTRNIKFMGASISNTSYMFFRPSCVPDIRWVEFQYCGSVTSYKGGAINSYCSSQTNYWVGISVWNPYQVSGVAGINFQPFSTGATADLIVIDKCVTYIPIGNTSYNIITPDNPNMTSLSMSNTIVIGGRFGFHVYVYRGVTLTNLVAANQYWYASGSHGFYIYGRTNNEQSAITTTNLEVYCSYNSPFLFNGYAPIGTYTNTKIWRCTASTATQSGLGHSNPTFAYNSNSNSFIPVVFNGIKILDIPAALAMSSVEYQSYTFIDGYFGNSGVSGGPSMSYSVYVYNNYSHGGYIRFRNCNFANASVANWFNYGFTSNYGFENCLFGSSTEILNQIYHPSNDTFSYSMNHNQIGGNHKAWSRNGTLSTDTTIYNTASPSMRMTPILTVEKLRAFVKKVAVNSGESVTVTVKVRESVVGDGAEYNGNRIRLNLAANRVISSYNEDTVLATATVASEGAWETLTAVLPAASADGVWELFVDCDGDTGWVNIDDWTVSVNNDVRSTKYWSNGLPYLGAEYTTGGGGGASGGAWTFVS